MATPDESRPRSHRRQDLDSTRWSIVLAVGDADSQIARDALAVLCEAYWYPVYCYIRRRVRSVDQAQDLTQEFFSRVLEKDYFADADPARGRFRAFLFTAVKHFLANEWHKANARKRGGGQKLVSLDFSSAESRYANEPTSGKTADALFDQQWAVTVVNHVVDLLRSDFAAADKGHQFDVLKSHLAGSADDASYAAAAESLKMSTGAVRVALHRMRKRYRELLKQEIGETVSRPSDIEDEIRSLFACLEA